MFEVFHISIIHFLALMCHFSIFADFHHAVLKLTLVQQCFNSDPDLLPNHTIKSDTTQFSLNFAKQPNYENESENAAMKQIFMVSVRQY